MKRTFNYFAFILLLTGTLAVQARTYQAQSLNQDWKFALGDVNGAEAADFDDSSWTSIDLPHDWSILGPFSSKESSGNDSGYLPTGIGWYRLHLNAKQSSRLFNKQNVHLLRFDGVYMNAEVFVNGHRLGKHPYGYTPFSFDIAPFIQADGDNVIAVRVDNAEQPSSRWYTGSGIYRPVSLLSVPDVFITPEAISVSTVSLNDERAVLHITVEAENATDKPQECRLRTTITERKDAKPSGSLSLTIPEQAITIPAHSKRTFDIESEVASPKVWTPDFPFLYQAKVQLLSTSEGKTHAEQSIDIPFGIRTVAWNATEGLLLNGKSIKLNGGCIHHDNGLLGAAAYDDAEYRKVKLMKEAGFNAVRTSHNPPSAIFLDACDELGLLVIDEAFDGWRAQKVHADYHLYFDEWAVADAQAMVRRDRNHPSIIAWSTGNEVIERKSPDAVTIAHTLAETIREIDATRPVTSALAAWDPEWEIFDPLAAEHDIVGYNYLIFKAESDHERVPNRVMWQTESYPRAAFHSWEAAYDHPYVIGDFVWTAIDYLGESGIGRWHYRGQSDGEHYWHSQWPYHGAYCGDIDITGLRKPISYYRQILWDETTPRFYMAVREPNHYHGQIDETSWSVWPTWESWTWPGWEGRDIEVEIYSRYPAVRLYLDDALIAERPTTRAEQFKATITLPYAPGTLKAVPVTADGREVADQARTLSTAGEPYALRIEEERDTYAPNDGDHHLHYLYITVVDKEGRPVPEATNELTITLKGRGKLIAFGNADMQENSSMMDAVHSTWHGRAMAVIDGGSARKGSVRIKATSPGLRQAKCRVRNKRSR